MKFCGTASTNAHYDFFDVLTAHYDFFDVLTSALHQQVDRSRTTSSTTAPPRIAPQHSLSNARHGAV